MATICSTEYHFRFTAISFSRFSPEN